jgi:hypothetical protein
MEPSSPLRAKLQFVRVLDIFCNSKDILWNIGGPFVKNILTHNEEHTDMEIYLYPKEVDSPKEVLKQLKVMKIIKTIKTKTNNSSHYCCGVEILHDITIYSFNVYLNISCARTKTNSFDNIVLSPVGMVVSSLDPKHDEYNINGGIALLERLIDLNLKEVRLSGSYFNANMNISVRKKNVKLMRAQDALINEGYKILGDNILKITKSTDDCPICYESALNSTKLKCDHTFCIQCLASHMNKFETHASACPLCRGLIELDIN